MGVEYVLINETKKEMISFKHLNGSKKRELAGNFAQSSIVTWYLLQNQGDQIQFVSDTYDDWPFKSGSRDKSFSYPDRTEQILKDLIDQEILKDSGYLYRDESDPENIYIKNITNVWEI